MKKIKVILKSGIEIEGRLLERELDTNLESFNILVDRPKEVKIYTDSTFVPNGGTTKKGGIDGKWLTNKCHYIFKNNTTIATVAKKVVAQHKIYAK